MGMMTLHSLVFSGPGKDLAAVYFGPGLNVIYGASETGKSFILEAIDFMLGSTRELRDIPERVGYDRILLGFEDPQGNHFTLERSTAGGRLLLFEGLHIARPEGVDAQSLSPRHSNHSENNISSFLLRKIRLAGKRIRRNSRGNTNTLSFRNLAHLCLVSEADIQKRESPIETLNPITHTSDMATFKLLLSGIDDSSVVSDDDRPVERLSRSSKQEIIDELILDSSQRLQALVGDSRDHRALADQAAHLDWTIRDYTEELSHTEEEYRSLTDLRRRLRDKRELLRDRRSDTDGLIQRFTLLDEHYKSDLDRLEGLREAGSLVAALSPQTCPLCGAAPSHQHRDEDCDGNIEAIVVAANVESQKINTLSTELRDSVDQIREESAQLDQMLPELESEIQTVQERIDAMSPIVKVQRSSFSALIEERATTQAAISILESMAELERKRDALDQMKDDDLSGEQVSFELSMHTLDGFSQLYEQVLNRWGVPDAERVYFDRQSRDLVIGGKPRGSRGKGMRAITHAAFSICLMDFAIAHELPHPGFVILDSPLLAYREPEGDEDDLKGTDVHSQFYEYLEQRSTGQTIILENVDPPGAIQKARRSVMFSKNPQRGRYGFFPQVTTS